MSFFLQLIITVSPTTLKLSGIKQERSFNLFMSVKFE